MTSALLFTIGHSNRSMDDFLEILEQANVRILVDIRAQPYSKRYPWFSIASLPKSLDAAGINYHWAGRQLGGKRVAQNDSAHIALPAGLRGFADYTHTDGFRHAANSLTNICKRDTTAMMCAERLPEHCHRQLISDYLTLQGTNIIHLTAADEMLEHQISPHARPQTRQGSNYLLYDRFASRELDLES